MRHRIRGKQLNRTVPHQRAMFRNLAAGLFEHGEIETTPAKAKAVQPFIERIITIAKRGGLSARRQIESMINDRKIFVWVADPNVPEERRTNQYFDLPEESEIEFNRYGEVRKAPRLVQHIMATIAPLFEDRDGGYTRIVKLDKHRLGDGTDLVLLQLVGQSHGPQISGSKSRRRAIADKRATFASKLRKGSSGSTAEDESATATAVAEPPEDETDAEETQTQSAEATDASPDSEQPADDQETDKNQR